MPLAHPLEGGATYRPSHRTRCATCAPTGGRRNVQAFKQDTLGHLHTCRGSAQRTGLQTGHTGPLAHPLEGDATYRPSNRTHWATCAPTGGRRNVQAFRQDTLGHRRPSGRTRCATDDIVAVVAGPLEGVRVVELGVWVAGPAAGGILADWGADVIKVEPTGGDPARMFRYLLGGDMPTNPAFEMDNRGKRSIAVDLTTDEGQQVLEGLFADADAFVTNVRLGGLSRLGLDHVSVMARHRRLVYAAVTGYGMSGDEADSGAFDVAGYWARSGIAHLLTPAGGDPPFQRGGMGDHTTGMTAAAGVCAALLARQRTGQGQLVSTSLLRTGSYTISFDLSITLGWGLTLEIGRRDRMGNPAMNNYTAGDGCRFWLVGLEPQRHWQPLARAVGRTEWLSDERYATPRARRDNAADLVGELDEIFASRPLAGWAEAFAAEPDLFWAPVQSPDELLADAQFAAAGGLVEVPDGSSTTTMIATPVDFSGTPWAPTGTAPRLGQHTDEILCSLGYSDTQIKALASAGTVRLDDSTETLLNAE